MKTRTRTDPAGTEYYSTGHGRSESHRQEYPCDGCVEGVPTNRVRDWSKRLSSDKAWVVVHPWPTERTITWKASWGTTALRVRKALEPEQAEIADQERAELVARVRKRFGRQA
ncbi:MAG: hypothetical protein ACRDWS_02060 [Acidimicrobiia bacterium]